MLLSTGFISILAIVYLYALRLFSFELIIFVAILTLYVIAVFKIPFNYFRHSYNPPFRISIKLSFEKIILIVLIAIMATTFTLGLFNTRFGSLADNDAYSYISTGKELFTQGPIIIKWQELAIQPANVLAWSEGKYQPLANGIDRLGFDLLEGAYGQLAGFTTISGQVLSLFFYSLLPVATYLVATIILRRRYALIAASMINFVPFIMWYSNRVLTEIPMTVFALFSIYFINEYVQKKSRSDLFYSYWHLFCLYS